MNKRETGIMGEKIACGFLENNGYKIIETNYRCRNGEMDIVARQRDTLVFIEVRTKKSYNFGTPEESITEKKKERLRIVAEQYQLDHTGLPKDWRIDLVAIQMNSNGKVCRVELIENAIEDIS